MSEHEEMGKENKFLCVAMRVFAGIGTKVASTGDLI